MSCNGMVLRAFTGSWFGRHVRVGEYARLSCNGFSPSVQVMMDR